MVAYAAFAAAFNQDDDTDLTCENFPPAAPSANADPADDYSWAAQVMGRSARVGEMLAQVRDGGLAQGGTE